MTHFEKFLINRGLLERFKHNLKKHGMCTDDFSLFLKITDENDYVVDSFSWADTKNGLSFWTKINAEWRDCYINEKL